ncbi:MAG: type II toxin-antitoxin system HicA family toxin [Leptospirales bacterium]
MKVNELLNKIRKNQKNIKFSDLQKLLLSLDFQLKRISGSHHIYSHARIVVAVNIQPDGPNAKPYQVKQLLKIIEKYGLKRDDL